MTSLKFWQRFVLILLCNGFAMLAVAAPQMAGHAITLTWTPATQPANIDAVSWNIYRSTANTGPYTLIGSVPVATLSYKDSAVTAGNEYFYAVTCVDSAGVESEYSASTDATVPIGDFNGTFDHYSASTNSDGVATYVFTMTASGGFQGNVTLNVSGLPPLATASFSPPVISGGSGTSILTVSASAGTPWGESVLTVVATGGNIVHWTTVTLLVGIVDFAGSISPNAQSISGSTGGSVEYSISLTGLGTKPFGDWVKFSISGLPPWVTADFFPRVVNPDTNGLSVLTLTVPPETPQGVYTPLITARSGREEHSTNIQLTVTP
ncbi:MAG TPA: hypothetical protein VGI34_04110 [Candidatus Acidoferrales bacterium]